MTIAATAWILLGAALRALLAACALWLGLRLLRVRNVRAQKTAWSVVLVAALAMPVVAGSKWLPAWTEIHLPALSWMQGFTQAPSPTVAAAPAVARTDEPVVATDATPLVAQPARQTRVRHARRAETEPVATIDLTATLPTPDARQNAPAPQKLPANSRGGGISLLAGAWLGYFAVAGVLLLRLMVGLFSSARIWLRARPVEEAAISGFDCGISVRSSASLKSPVNIGSGIVLPADFGDWDREKLRVVLAHEGAHIRQRDFYMQVAAGIYTAFNWFSPLGWWLKHKLSELSEAICDEAGLSEASSRSSYAQLLLEFAAQPRPTFTGVAMAHSSNLSQRIERLLNESNFKQAFSGTRRALAAALVFPAVLFSTAAMIHVAKAAPLQQANGTRLAAQTTDQSATPAPAAEAAPAPITGQANPTQVTGEPQGQAAAPAPQPAPEPAPAAAPNGEAAPAAPPAPPSMQGQEPVPSVPGVPPIDVQVHVPPIPPMPDIHVHVHVPQGPCMGNGDAYAIVGDPGTKTRFCGDWGDEGAADVEKARGQAHGHFLLFRHEGKLYIVDDPATVSQIEAAHQQVELQGEKMRALGRQMREAGEQAREAARKARETAKTIPAPDLSKQIADLDAAVADLKAHQGSTVTREQLAEVQHKVNELQRSLMSAEWKGDFDAMNSEMWKSFSAEQGKFGEQMGQMGAEMGRLAREDHEKMRSIIDDSLKNGKARPVQ
jgi:beta-lactamase regulating signal transducer with metallopeptidase domain